MTSIAVLFISICLLASHHIRALPPINFTDTILTNRMIEALNEALVTRDGEQLSPFQQLRQHLYQQQQHVPEQQYYPQAPVAYPQHTPEQQQPSHSFFPDQQPAHSFFPEQPQQQPSHPFYPQQIPDQQQPTHSFYPQQLPEQQQPFYPQQLPDQQQQQQQLYQQHLLEQQAFNQQQQQQQHTQPPHHFEHVFPPVSQPTLPPIQHPTQPAHSSFLPVQQQQQQHPLQPTHPSYLPEQQQQQQHPLPPTHPSYLPEQQQQQQQPASNQPDSPGYYYPYPYQNINWYNFANLWPGVTNANPNPVAPVAHTGSQTSVSTTSNDCPVGFCPKGGSCSQLSGQWQCGCNTNDCVGVANPCGIFGQYYFPYYPDATRFIQCDQTGVFWIRRCGPGTIFDPKISVCNYPPVVVETGKK